MKIINMIVAALLAGIVGCTSAPKQESETPEREIEILNEAFVNGTAVEQDAAFYALSTFEAKDIVDSWWLLDYFIGADTIADGKYHDAAFAAALKEIETSPFFNNHLFHYKRLMPVAASVEEKREIISRIGDYRSYMALVFLDKYIDDEELKEPVANAVLSITIPELGGRAGVTGTFAKELMEKVSAVDAVALAGDNRLYIDHFMNSIPEEEAYVAPAAEEGFVSLFNGENLDGWMGDKAAYVVSNGLIVVRPEETEGEGRISTEKEYSDFIFRFEFQLTPAANNGIGIRNGLEGDPAYQAMESQILDDDYEGYVSLGAAQFHGSVYGVIAAEKGALNPMGEWNSEEIMIHGRDVKITLNGKVIVDGNLDEAVANKPKVAKAHPGLQRTKGHISFLGHGDVVRFRNIRVKEL